MALPYGLRDVKFTRFLDAAGTELANESVDLPVAQSLEFSEVEDFNNLRGDDRLVASHGSGASVEWSLEAGGLNFEAYQVMAGGTIVEEGVPGSGKRTYSKKSTDQRPWFRIEGQAINEDGGDTHGIIYKAKATGDLEGTWEDGEFFITSASGIGIGDEDDNVYDFVENDIVTAFAEPNPTAVPLIETATPTAAAATTTVALTGDRFTGTTGVTVGGVAGTNIVIHTDELLSFRMPAGGAGSAPIVVTNAAGASDPKAYTRGA